MEVSRKRFATLLSTTLYSDPVSMSSLRREPFTDPPTTIK
jgi:hypothetical protein